MTNTTPLFQTTLLPGFIDPVHDAQQTFRALLNALARPGIVQSVPFLTAPPELTPSCAAACLTLLDLETRVWLQPCFSDAVRSWLLFHTGCRFTAHSQDADFAVMGDIVSAPALEQFSIGTPEYPEASTSLLIQLPMLHEGSDIILRGPGVLEAIAIQLPLPPQFWQQWQAMTIEYPLGLDVWCCANNQILGLPRTARLSPKKS